MVSGRQGISGNGGASRDWKGGHGLVIKTPLPAGGGVFSCLHLLFPFGGKDSVFPAPPKTLKFFFFQQSSNLQKLSYTFQDGYTFRRKRQAFFCHEHSRSGLKL
jgi:hypothetical protein